MKLSILLVGSFLVLSLGIGITGLAGTAFINENIADIVERELPKVKNIADMKNAIGNAGNSVSEFIKLERQVDKQGFEANTARFELMLRGNVELVHTAEEKSLLDQLKVLLDSFHDKGSRLIAAHESQTLKVAERDRLLDERVVPVLRDMLQKGLDPLDPDYAAKWMALNELKMGAHALVSDSGGYVLTGDPAMKEAVLSDIRDFELWLGTLQAGPLTEKEREQARAVAGDFAAVRDLSTQILDLEGEKQDLLAQFRDASASIWGILDDRLEPLAIASARHDAQEAANATSITSIALVTAIVFAVVLGVLLSRYITKPLKALEGAASSIAKGNLDQRITIKGTGELAQLSRSFNAMAEKLKINDAMQREFISIASHELRNPIQPILNYADLAKKGLIPTGEALDVVMEEAGRLSFLANNILDVSRIESGQLVYRMEKFFINGDIFSAIESTRSALKPGVSIEADLAPCEKIEGDRGRISQVIANVLLNAVRYTDKGRILVQSRVVHPSAAAGGSSSPDAPPTIAIKISDTWRGIPEDILPKVFDKFVTTSSREGSKEGTGLGLYISRAIVEAHGGRMVAYNNEQGGATFEILLPFSQAAQRGPR